MSLRMPRLIAKAMIAEPFSTKPAPGMMRCGVKLNPTSPISSKQASFSKSLRSSAHDWLALLYLATSKPAEAIAEMKQWIRLSGRSDKYSSDLAVLYATSNQPIEARRILKSLLAGVANPDYSDPFDTARIYAALGDRDQAFASLETAYARHSLGMMWLEGNPQFDSLHADPRFHEMVRRVWHMP